MLPHRINILLAMLFIISRWDSVAGSEDPKLPSIWDVKNDGHGEVTEQSYRFVAEIQLVGSARFFLIEEWFSDTKQMFRLDLIESANGKRNTILVNKNTNEKFYYTPFKCSLIKDFKEVLDPELADNFPAQIDGSIVPLGIGSIWLYAMNGKHYFIKPNQDSNHSLNVGEHSIKTFNFVTMSFNRFAVEAADKFNKAIIMYFRGDSATDGPKSLALIHVGKQKKSRMEVQLRIKILDLETPWLKYYTQDDDASKGDVFALPVGYGCVRGKEFEHSLANPIDIMSDRASPHVLELNVVISQPIDLVRHDYHKWKTNSFSVRLLGGRLGLNGEHKSDYLVTEVQDFRPIFESPKLASAGGEVRRATLRRLRKVWDLGDRGELSELDGLTYRRSSIKGSGATYFEIDEQTGKCLGYGETQPELSGSIELPFVGGSPANKGDRANTTDDANADAGQPIPLAGLSLNTELVRAFFSSPDGYHLIRENESKLKRSSELTYERRQNSFELTDKSGKPIWSGPVSIIRSHSLSLNVLTVLFGMRYKTRVTIHFYSKSLDLLMGKIHLDIKESRLIDEAYFHRELNVGACFAHLRVKAFDDGNQVGQQQAGNTNLPLALFSKQSASLQIDTLGVDFVISYPIQSADVASKLSIGYSSEEMFYKETLRAIDAALDGQLDPLQLVNIEVNFGESMIKVSGKLLERPSLLDYRREAGRKFSTTPKRDSIFTEFAQDEESCAETCGFYDCSMFSYCQSNKMCDLVLMKDSKQPSTAIPFEPNLSCSLFRPRTGKQRVPIEPHEMVRKLRDTILSGLGDQNGPLTLKVNYFDDERNEQNVELNPSSIESGAFLEEEVEDLIGDATVSNSSETNLINSKIVMGGDSKLAANDRRILRPKYLIAFENRKFKLPPATKESFDVFPLKQAEHMSYEDCGAFCDSVDCKSFSYCQIEKTCLVSQLHKTGEIFKQSLAEDYCFILARDYLSKFKRTIKAKLPTKTSKLVQAPTVRECAISCMEEQVFKCKSFYYCTHDGGCHLRRAHLSSRSNLISVRPILVEPTKSMDGQIASTNGSIDCDLYSRSFLSEFDRFHGKALPDFGDETSVVYRSSSAETCALECADRKGTCQAFHVCMPDPLHGPTCVLMLNKTLNVLGSQAKLDKLVVNSMCTTFVVNQASELILITPGGDSEEAIEGPTIAIDDEEVSFEASNETGSRFEGRPDSHWLFGLFLLFVGSAIGYGATAALGLRLRR